MTPIVRRALFSSVAMTIGAALLVLSVALMGEGLAWAAVVRSCIRLEGALLPMGVLALIAGLVVIALTATELQESRQRKGPRP